VGGSWKRRGGHYYDLIMVLLNLVLLLLLMMLFIASVRTKVDNLVWYIIDIWRHTLLSFQIIKLVSTNIMVSSKKGRERLEGKTYEWKKVSCLYDDSVPYYCLWTNAVLYAPLSSNISSYYQDLHKSIVSISWVMRVCLCVCMCAFVCVCVWSGDY